MDFTNIVIAILYICFSIVTICLIPYIRTRLTSEEQDVVSSIAKTVVYAAQQLFGSENAKEKKKYAMEQVEAALGKYGIKLSTTEISDYIESALKDIKTSLTNVDEW